MESIPTRKLRFPREALNIMYIVAGLLCCTAAYRLYLVPNNIAAGGFTGVGQLLNHLFGIRVGLVSALMNIPLFLISIRKMGIKYGLRSFCAMLTLSFLIDYMPFPRATDDMLLACVFGGVLGGIGFGLIIRGNASTGGTDMLASLLHRYIPVIRIGVGIFIFDGLVIAVSAFVFDQIAAMYALICVFIMNTLTDVVLNGPDNSKSFIIISDHAKEIAERIINEMERGVTSLNGKGVFSNTDKEVLLCVINKYETMAIRRIIFSTDPKAFVIVENTHEVFGEGFQSAVNTKH